MTSQTNSIPCFGTAFNTVSSKPRPKKRMAPLSIRLTAEQRTQLEHDAASMSLNAYALSRLFDDYKPKRKRRVPTKPDKAIASALRRMAHSGIAAYLASQIVAQEEGRLGLSLDEEMELRGAYSECYCVRRDLVEALELEAEYDISFPPITTGR